MHAVSGSPWSCRRFICSFEACSSAESCGASCTYLGAADDCPSPRLEVNIHMEMYSNSLDYRARPLCRELQDERREVDLATADAIEAVLDQLDACASAGRDFSIIVGEQEHSQFLAHAGQVPVGQRRNSLPCARSQTSA